MKKNCKMISFDSSTKLTGYALFVDGTLSRCGVLDHSKEKDMEIRMEDMCFGIINLLNKEKPDIVVVEMTVVPNNASTQRQLTELIGVIRGWALINYAEFVRMRPSEWRHLVADQEEKIPIKRADAKIWAVEKVKLHYNIDATDDTAEAILIGQARINQFAKNCA